VFPFSDHSYLLEIKANFPNLFKDNSKPQIQPHFPLTHYDGIEDRIKIEAEENDGQENTRSGFQASPSFYQNDIKPLT
jgi:hypothetical protein